MREINLLFRPVLVIDQLNTQILVL